MWNTSLIGNKSEAIVLAALVHAGYSTLLPFGGGHPYDIVVDDGGTFRRVQCKTGRLLKEGVVFFPTASWCRNLSYRSYRGYVDLFGVYCAGTEQVYLVPIEEVPEKGAYLRVAPTRNAQASGIRWARDYVIWSATDGGSAGLVPSVTAIPRPTSQPPTDPDRASAAPPGS